MKRIKVRPGRPSAIRGTVRVYVNGWARLSRDLVIGKAFRVSVDSKKKVVKLVKTKVSEKGAVKLWYSNAHARSPLMSFTTILEALGKTSVEAKGEYAATVSGSTVTVDFNRRRKR